MWRVSAFALAACAITLGAGVSPVRADPAVRIGALKLSSSAPLFIGVDKGFFKEYGIDPELVYRRMLTS